MEVWVRERSKTGVGKEVEGEFEAGDDSRGQS